MKQATRVEVEVLELADMFRRPLRCASSIFERYLGRSVKLDELQVVISQAAQLLSVGFFFRSTSTAAAPWSSRSSCGSCGAPKGRSRGLK